MSRTPTCEQVRLLDGTPTRIRHGHGIDEPCPFGPRPDRASAEGLRALADRWEAEGQRRDADPTRHHDPVNVLAAGIYHEHAEALRAALRDTGPRPDSGISRSVIRRQNVMAGREMNKGIAGPRPDSGIDAERLAEVFARALEDQDFTGFRNWLALAREVAAEYARLSTPETSK